MVLLAEILTDMQNYDWQNVPNCKSKKKTDQAKLSKKKRWEKVFKKSGLVLDGLVLDVACGPISLGLIYDNIIGYDIDPSCIKEIHKNGISGVIGDVRKLPFDDDTFDISISIGPPSRPYKPNAQDHYKKNNLKALVKRVTSEMIRVTKKQVLLTNHNYATDYAPRKFRKYVKRKGRTFILYDLKK